jgi:type II secretory pathway component GspD/PulD (secretin)
LFIQPCMKTLLAIALISFAGCSVCDWTPSREDVRVYPLQHADGQSVVKKLASESKGTLKELAFDSRTNAIIAKGEPEGLDRLGRRIRELDTR